MVGIGKEDIWEADGFVLDVVVVMMSLSVTHVVQALLGCGWRQYYEQAAYAISTMSP